MLLSIATKIISKALAKIYKLYLLTTPKGLYNLSTGEKR